MTSAAGYYFTFFGSLPFPSLFATIGTINFESIRRGIPTSVIEEKKALRTFIRKKERTLDPVYKAESSEAICRHLLALDEYKSAKVVFAFAGTEKEIDTSLFMNETIAAGKTLILPRCAAEHAIDLCVVRSMDDLEAGAYGILEPKKNCALVTAADIDFAGSVRCV